MKSVTLRRKHAVEDVSRRAAQNQRHAGLAEPAAGAARGKQPNDQADDADGKNNQHGRAPRHLGIREQAKRDAGIVRVHEIQQAGNQDAGIDREP